MLAYQIRPFADRKRRSLYEKGRLWDEKMALRDQKSGQISFPKHRFSIPWASLLVAESLLLLRALPDSLHESPRAGLTSDVGGVLRSAAWAGAHLPPRFGTFFASVSNQSSMAQPCATGALATLQLRVQKREGADGWRCAQRHRAPGAARQGACMAVAMIGRTTQSAPVTRRCPGSWRRPSAAPHRREGKNAGPRSMTVLTKAITSKITDSENPCQ
jgi:hypothetical protein